MRMRTSGHNQLQVSTTVERAICEDFIVDTCVSLRQKKLIKEKNSIHKPGSNPGLWILGEVSLELRLPCSASCKVGAQGFDTCRLRGIYGKDNRVTSRNALIW